MYYSTGIELLIFSNIFKTYCQSQTKHGFLPETTPTFSGLPKEHFGQVSKIPKIAPKLTKTHVL